MLTTVPTDGLANSGAKPSASTALTTWLYMCDKLDRICQVGFAGAWHWLASGHSDAYCDVFDVCACVCAV